MLRALAFASASHPDSLAAVTVNVDGVDTSALQQEWDEHDLPVQLTVIDSPYREITRPVVDHVKNLRREGPRDVVAVYIPEYVVGRWWENLLHNQSALRLKARLLFEPGIMVINVPWQLHSSTTRDLDRVTHIPGQLRRGATAPPDHIPATASEHSPDTA
jgi:hypothetical protein